MPSAISSHANTVGARHRSIGMEAASRNNRSFSAYPSSVSGDQLRYGSTASVESVRPHYLQQYLHSLTTFSIITGIRFRILSIIIQ